jgi:hypothetical protein
MCIDLSERYHLRMVKNNILIFHPYWMHRTNGVGSMKQQSTYTVLSQRPHFGSQT